MKIDKQSQKDDEKLKRITIEDIRKIEGLADIDDETGTAIIATLVELSMICAEMGRQNRPHDSVPPGGTQN